ncbi:MAG: flagellar hook-associated protein FlgK [Firmicutes bacterium]|nr:flagellar hook-associated protein FlgK [Bacillota bacterium]
MNYMALGLASNTMSINRKALEIIGQNISNANVEGYTRQSAQISSYTYGYSITPADNGVIDVSARITDITRMRNQTIDNSLRKETSSQGSLDAKQTYLDEMAQLFTDNSSNSMSTSINSFFKSWNTAAQNPEDSSIRGMVISQGTYLSNAINTKMQNLDEMSSRVSSDIKSTVDEINSYINQLAQVNDDIVKSVSSSVETNLLLDKKDLIMDKLSALVGVQVDTDIKNSNNVFIGGIQIVAGKTAMPISVTEDASHNYHIMSTTGKEINVTDGKLAGLLEVKEEIIPQYQAKMDEWAQGIMTEVNNIHKYGYGQDGSTGLNFFSGTGAADMKVNITDADQVAMSVPTLTSPTNMNVDNTKLYTSFTLTSQAANFKTTPDASGTVVVNGSSVAWDNSQSLETILNNIKTATGISWSFDASSQKITLSSPPNSSTITISDTTGNFGVFTGLGSATLKTGSVGDGDNALKIYELSTKNIYGTPATETVSGRYQSISTDIGYDANINLGSQSAQTSYVASLQESKEGVSGVSIDEEMIKMLQFQRGYQAGAKLASVVDEMLQSLLQIT